MTFRVVWRRRAEAGLAEIWIDNPNERTAITAASAQIEYMLSIAPEDCGESRAGQ